LILGIESSCDESAMALFSPEAGLAGEWVDSQIAHHQPYGGIVPDIASREHLRTLPALWSAVQAHPRAGEVRSIAVTSGPGLAGCLALGISAARAIGRQLGVPVKGVNHLRGHVFSPFIELHAREAGAFGNQFAARLPHLGLVVSGGNTVLVKVDQDRRIEVLGGTVDDAAGEALDKGAKLLGMPYPGGPLIEKQAAGGNPDRFSFPRAFAGESKVAFSFSGLKTSLRYLIQDWTEAEFENALADLCASYESAVLAALAGKVGQVLASGGWKSLGLSGGVANNQRLREAFEELGGRYDLPVLLARPEHTGDNAAMIAFASWLDPAGTVPDNEMTIKPAWRL